MNSSRLPAPDLQTLGAVTIYDATPTNLMRLVNVERARLLIEAQLRPALQRFLPRRPQHLRTIKTWARWHLEVDTLEM